MVRGTPVPTPAGKLCNPAGRQRQRKLAMSSNGEKLNQRP